MTTTPGANAAAVAELTVGLMLALCRRLVPADAAVRRGEWPATAGRELGARTVGLLGLGHVGQRVAVALRALGTTVVAHDPYAEATDVEQVTREQLLARSEILSLHVPATPETRGMVDRDVLAALPEGALLVNTARGELIDEDALLWALDHGPLAGAALDALRDEPPGADHPLVGRSDVLVTPHIGGQTAEARAAMARVAVDELLAVLDGREPRYPGMSDGLERLRAARLIAVLRSESPEAAVNAAVALADAGVRAIELTFTTPGAPEALRAARERLPADVRPWLDAGAMAVGAGGELCPPALVRAADWDGCAPPRGRSSRARGCKPATRGAVYVLPGANVLTQGVSR